MTTLIARLKAAAETATPGPWKAADRMVVEAGCGDAVAMVNLARPENRAFADAELIALLGSNALRIVAALEAAQAWEGLTVSDRGESGDAICRELQRAVRALEEE